MGDVVSINRIGRRRGLLRAPSAVARYDRGCALEATAPAEAMATYRRAVAGHPDLADAHNNLGRLHHDRGELADAESCYRLAICGDGAVALYWFNLGVVAEDRGRIAEAVAAYERALELDPDMADAHYNMARLFELVGRATGAWGDAAISRAIRHLSQYKRLARRR
ncbi:MAG: tetratricopeptide repeat protein [Proteobacteria bacterium]|nr:tetratricopeptide repeat protein [Pseudomonadota bacterium]